jgi:hypothetical protein
MFDSKNYETSNFEAEPNEEEIINGLNELAKNYGISLGELNIILSKRVNKNSNNEKLKSNDTENLNQEKYFSEFFKELILLKINISMRYLQYAGVLSNVFSEEKFNKLCKKYYLSSVSENPRQAINEINEKIDNLKDLKNKLIKEGFFPGKQVKVKRSSGQIENDWTIYKFIDGKVIVTKPNPADESQFLRKNIDPVELINLNSQ